MTLFAQPESTREALALLAGKEWTLLAGGTDFYPSLGNKQPAGNVLDLSRLSELRAIRDNQDHWHIGALTTWTDIIKSGLPASFDALKLAAKEVGSPQIQNRGTVVGNICNASPAADGIPALLCLDAIVRSATSSGTRDTPLKDFVVGNRKTILEPGEMVVEVLIPKASATGRSTFIKLGARRYLVISIAMCAARISVDKNNVIDSASLSMGSCSVVAIRLHKLEQALIGQTLSPELCNTVQPQHFKELSPIDDVRSSAMYRLDAAAELVKRTLATLVHTPKNNS